MHDSPGLEVRDDTLDDVADLVDLFIELFFQSARSRCAGFLMRVSMSSLTLSELADTSKFASEASFT